jgi:hypothetical protein
LFLVCVPPPENKSFVLAFTLIFIFGFITRFYHLGSIPAAAPFGDEAANGVDAIKSIRNLDFKVFYPTNNGREPLFIWLTAITHSFLTPTVSNLRIVSAIIGFLTVFFLPFCFIEIDTLFSRKQHALNKRSQLISALIATCFLASSMWHINFSRIAFRGILDPFFAVLSILLICKTLKKKENIISAIFTGFILGIGLYGYGSFKFLFPLVIIILIVGIRKYNTGHLLIFILLAGVITAIPLINFIVSYPEIYFTRMTEVSIFSRGDSMSAFLNALKKLCLMFFLHGDENPRHNVNGQPQFHFIPFIFMVFGIIKFIVIPISNSFLTSKNKIFDKPFNHKTTFFILIWIAIMLLPAALTHERQPHSLRAIGTIVPAVMLGGIGFSFILQLFNKLVHNRRMQTAFLIICIASLIYTQSDMVKTYFLTHVKSEACKKAFYTEQHQTYKNFVESKKTPKLLILEKENKIDKVWHLQSLYYITNCQLLSNNIEEMNIQKARLMNTKKYNSILCPRKYVNQFKGNNVMYY